MQNLSCQIKPTKSTVSTPCERFPNFEKNDFLGILPEGRCFCTNFSVDFLTCSSSDITIIIIIMIIIMIIIIIPPYEPVYFVVVIGQKRCLNAQFLELLF